MLNFAFAMRRKLLKSNSLATYSSFRKFKQNCRSPLGARVRKSISNPDARYPNRKVKFNSCCSSRRDLVSVRGREGGGEGRGGA